MNGWREEGKEGSKTDAGNAGGKMGLRGIEYKSMVI